MDISRLKGIDLESATQAITLALAGNARLLKQLGIDVPEHASKETMLGLVLEKVKGQAEGYGNTLAGAQEKSKVAFENLQETVGAMFLPVLTNLFTSIATWLNSDKTQAWLQGIGDFINTKVIPAFQAFGKFLSEVVIPAIRDTLTPAWDRAMEAIKPHLPLLKDIAKYLGIIIGATIIGGIEALGLAVAGIIGFFAQLLQTIKDIIKALKTMGEKTGLGNKGGPLGALADLIKGRQMGGFVSTGKPYVVGERGPELFVPSQSGKIIPNNKMGGSININFNNPVVRSESDFSRIIAEVKRALNRDLALEKLRV